ncbi:helix-turn-helix domain-containing protein [Methylibium sp.]|jgi:AraC family ethanolamine operon transcriptional activator|uniref:helix-turn-helix domain-containing protein n=1 Tax=Methylibium sp. TaxID=2067992 RepID=UPI003D09E422
MALVLEHQSADVDDQAKALTGWQQRYEQLGRGRFRGSARQVVMAGGTVLRESTNRQLREQIRPPSDCLVLAIPLSVAPGSVFAGRPLDADALMVISGHDEYDLVAAGELDLLALSVDRRRLDSMLAPHEIEWLAQAERQRRWALAADTAGAVRGELLAVCKAAERGAPGAVIDLENESALIGATLAHMVALAMSGGSAERSDAGIPRRADSRLRVVKRAIEFIRENLQEDIGIPEICTAACASRRSLQYCFEEFLHTTPQAYLRALRLNEARRRLKQQADQPITLLACTMGFSSASHFTRHYRLMFNELPSQTQRLGGEGMTKA